MPDNYSYQNNSNNNNNGNKKSGIPWWAIVACFCCGIWPLGIVLLVLRLGQESGAFSSRQGRANYDRFAEEARRAASDTAQAARDAAAQARDAVNQKSSQYRENAQYKGTPNETEAAQGKKTKNTPQKQGKKSAYDEEAQGAVKKRLKKLEKLKAGNGFTVLGAILMGVFGLSSVVTFAENFTYLFYEPLWMLEEMLLPFVLTGVGAGLFTWGRFKKSQTKRFRRYIKLIGDQKEIPISALAAAYPAKRDAACTTLENMIEAGLFGEQAYLDYGRDMLVLDGSGVKVEQPPQKKTAPETDIGEENALLRQIRQVNDAIENPELSRKIDRIGEITERILEFQKEHPDKAGELRKFLNYYLPTTLKILDSYAELEKQGVEGENIAATKQRIEGMMDMVVEGFERQLDKLFAGDMMDIAADITVMEQMMQGDGLFDGEGKGMGGH